MKSATKSTRRRAFLARNIADMIFENDNLTIDRIVQRSDNRSGFEFYRESFVRHIKDLLEKYKV